jgi:hypothetical protein
VLLDQEELAHAEEESWLSPATVAAARAEAARLAESARCGRWPPPVVESWTRERARDVVLWEAARRVEGAGD